MHLSVHQTTIAFAILLLFVVCVIPPQLLAAGLTLKPSPVWFGATDVRQVESASVTLTNTSSSSVYVSKVSVTGSQFRLSGLTAPFSVAARKTKQFSVIFHPTIKGSFDGKVSIWRKGVSLPLVLSLHGNGVTGSLVASPPSESFGTVALGTRKTINEVLTNRSSAAITIAKVSVVGSGFRVSGLSIPSTLAVGQSYTFSISFSPQVAGSQPGSVSISSNAANSSLRIGLAGTGGSGARLALGTSTLNFGNVAVGSNKSLSGVLIASGGSVRISSASSSSTEFSLRGISLPLTLAGGQRIPFTVQFAPRLAGAAAGRIVFNSSAQNTPAVQNLAGAGGSSSRHRVVLQWKPSTSIVSGYNIYRGTSSGGPYSKINPDLNLSTSFVDDSVQSGKTYFYVLKAVNGKGAQSQYSSQVKATVPY
jgi:Abnormal spindle-like microcephaly-assoc'd, ASPM-SPD-2-Hydin